MNIIFKRNGASFMFKQARHFGPKGKPAGAGGGPPGSAEPYVEPAKL